MEIQIDSETMKKTFASMEERFDDEELEDALFEINKEALEFALEQLGGGEVEDLFNEPERLALAGALAGRWMAVQILTYRELIAGTDGDAPPN